MKLSTDYPDKTHARLVISGDIEELTKIKDRVLQGLGTKNVNVPGFRKGKAPLAMVEKQLDPNLLQSEFLDHAINDLYAKAVDDSEIRIVGQPKVELTKFVPFTTLEFTAETEIIGKIKLGSYKDLKIKKQVVKVTDDDVNEVLSRLANRGAEKIEVKKSAKNGDEVVIDFTGSDAKTKDLIPGADGKEYPLVLGSKSFIPGFEEELIGLKSGDEKEFDIVFPKDYGSKELQSKKVTFKVKVNKVNEVKTPKIDDVFAEKVGPFKSLADLKDDIKKQITAEQQQAADREYENNLVIAIAKKMDVVLPETIINEQLDRMNQELRQDLMYQGKTWQEYLKMAGVTEEELRKQNREQAELRAKAGLALSEIADTEKIVVEQAEFDAQLDEMKKRYPDEKMQEELKKPEAQRDIISRILTQKTLDKLKELNPSN